MIPLAPNAERITDVTYFEPWRSKEGAWKPGKNGKPVPYESFAGFCEDLIEALSTRNVSTTDPLAVAAADRAERTLRTKRPDADPAHVRRVALIDAVKGGLIAFAPAAFDGNTRSKGTCERVTVYAADHDHETEESWAAAVAVLDALGVAWFAYGSPKDGVLGVRRRMLISLSRDVTPKESARLRAIVPALLELTPDPSTIGDESRLFYIGMVDGVEPYKDGSPDGECAIDVDALLAEHPEAKKRKGVEQSRFGAFVPHIDRVCPANVEPLAHAQSLARSSAPAVQGEGGHTTLFNLACDIVCGLKIDPDDARVLLWDLYNPRCVPPWEAAERKDFDRKLSEAQECEREPGYLLSGSVSTAEVFAPAQAPLNIPVFLRSRDGHVTLMWEGDQRGHRPIADKIITTRIEELGYPGGLLETKEQKTGREYRPDELLKLYGATYTHTAYAFANTVTRYSSADEGRVVIGYPIAPLVARFDTDADAWLRALAGAHYSRLAVWIASCAQSAIDRLSACLVLIGDADLGKSMFGHAVALLWGSTPPPLELTTVQFNADLLRCPILVDEEAQLFGSRALSTKRFRDIIQSPSRSVERKGKERCELIGAMRGIVNCNGYSDLRFTDLGGPAVIRALRDRLLVINASRRSEACRGPLERLRLPGAYIVDLPRVAAHMAWLCQSIKLPAERFLGAGGDDSEGAILAGHVEEHADVWETFREWLESGAGTAWSAHEGHGLCVDTSALAQSIERTGKGWDVRSVREALAPYRTADYRHGTRGERKRLWVLDVARVVEALDLDADEIEALEKCMSALAPALANPVLRHPKFG